MKKAAAPATAFTRALLRCSDEQQDMTAAAAVEPDVALVDVCVVILQALPTARAGEIVSDKTRPGWRDRENIPGAGGLAAVEPHDAITGDRDVARPQGRVAVRT